MKWPWSKPAPLPIPPYPITQERVIVRNEPKPEPGIVVEEHDVSDMTKTGVHRAWDRLTGKFKGE